MTELLPTTQKNSYDNLPSNMKSSQGLRQRDFNRRSQLNPKNDREVRLSQDFYSMQRGHVLSPKIAMPMSST